MVKYFLLAAICFITSFAFPQSYSRYRIDFTDKNNSPFSIAEPAEFLSQRAIERRLRFNIAITEQDLPVNPHYLDSLRAAGAAVLHSSKWFNSCVINTSDSNVLQQIAQFPFVMQTSPVGRKPAQYTDTVAQQPVMDLRINSEIHWSTTSEFYGWSHGHVSQVKGEKLHVLGYRGEGVWIAVMDAGFINVQTLPVFAHLFRNHRIVATRDFVDGDDFVYEASSHGTSVLSIMSADSQGVYIGTAPDAHYLLLRTEESGSELIAEEENWIAAAEFADSIGADVFNTSLGYTTFDDSTMNHSPSDLTGDIIRISIAADIAASKGIIVVNSAGNEGNSPWQKISAPSDGDSVVCVGAVDPQGMYASFSGKGFAADGAIKPNIAATGKDMPVFNSQGKLVFGNGTSFSGPLVAGMFASLRQVFPEKTNMEMLHAVEQCASRFMLPDSLVGYGIPDFYCAYKRLADTDETLLDSLAPVKVYPNPFDQQLTVFYHNDTASVLMIELFDLGGRRLFASSYSFNEAGYHHFELRDFETLASGTYILRFYSDQFRHEELLFRMP
jgi:hypothetical protein